MPASLKTLKLLMDSSHFPCSEHTICISKCQAHEKIRHTAKMIKMSAQLQSDYTCVIGSSLLRAANTLLKAVFLMYFMVLHVILSFMFGANLRVLGFGPKWLAVEHSRLSLSRK